MVHAHFAACPEGSFDFTSGCSLAFLRAIIPSALVALALLSLIPVPRLVKKLAFPVIDTIEDRTSINAISSTRVKETLEANKHVGPPRWKQAVLIGGGLVASLWWMVILGLNIVHVTSAGAGRKQIVWRAWTTGMIIFSWLYLLFRPIFRPSRTPHYPSFAIYIVHLAVSSLSLCSLFYLRAVNGVFPPHAHSPVFLVGEILTWIVSLSGILTIMSFTMVDDLAIESSSVMRLDDKVTLGEWITFSWVSPLIKLGHDHDLADEEIPPLSRSMCTAESYDTLQSYGKSSLMMKIIRANSLDIMLDVTLTMASVVFNYASPFLIKRILDAITSPTPELRARAYVYASLAFLSSVAKAQVDVFHLWHGRRTSVRAKNQLIAAIYDKALRRKDTSGIVESKETPADKKSAKETAADKKKGKEAPKQQAADSGRVVSLMASDSTRIAFTASGLYFIVGGCLEVPVAAIFLYSLLGYSAFVGFIVMVIASPLTSMFMKRYIAIQQEASKARDKRITVMNELITAIKFIKFFGWTAKWQSRVADARKAEMKLWIKNLWNGLLFNMVYIIGPMAVTLISFTWYIFVAKGELTVSVAFTSLSLFSMIRQPLNIIPQFGVMMAQAYVSVQRIEDFLKEDEVPDWVSSLKRPTPAADAPVDTRIGFDNADFKWNTGMTAEDTKKAAQETAAKKTNGNGVPAEEEEEEILPFELNDLDITFPAGKLSVIAGPTGSGKSAMLLALLGEMDCVKGTVFLPKENTQIDKLSGLRNAVAYCSQSPWLQHKSIKENILFGEEFDETRYHMTLEACALVPDLEVLDDGDETEIGVRGVSLSGGQKARIALARAVYSRTAHVLLDDILAAVDSHTAKDLVEGCLKGPLLQGRTVLLVSHHVELLLPVTDYLVRILDGRIENAGTPSELREKGLLNGFLTSEETDNEKQAADNDEQIAAETRVLEEQDHKETTKEKLDKKSRPGRKLVKDEERASGSVTWATYKTYLVASTWTVWIFTVVLLTASQGTTLGERWWLKIWGEAYQYSLQAMSTFTTSTMGHVDGSFSTHSIHFANQHQQHLFAAASTNQTMTVEKIGLPKMPSANVHPGFYVLGLFIIDLTGFLIAMISSLNSAWGSYKAAVSIHDNMLSSVMRSTVRFYDTTPSGRIINRFSKDVETIDNSLSSNLKQVLANVGVLFGAIFLVAVILPGFLIPAAFIAYAFYYLTIRYLSASRSMRRIESTKRSPIFSGFNEVLDGISIVRAFGAERMFTKRLFDQVDESQAAFYYLWMCNRWLLYRFDFLGGFAVFLTTILALSGAVSPGSAGVAILSSQSLVMGVYWISRNWGQLEQDFNSVERAKEYLDLPQEPAAIIPNSRPPAYWPSDSNKENFLRVENLSIRYAPELPDVLHDLTFTIKAKERIGVIGRTGSGKSTFAMALLRFVDPSAGKIILDGIDVCTIGLDDLRRNITYIPQEAVLFTGTIRENLDPFQEHSDEELTEALEKVRLGAIPTGRTPADSLAPSRVPSSTNLTEEGSSSVIKGPVKGQITLDTQVSSGGGSLSAGQKQLIAMARALLRRSNLILADECSASLDTATDEAIQETMRTEFANACVITIAHRLSTIIDYDRLLVLSNGKIQEFDTPWNLLNRDSVFKGMAAKTGHFNDLYEAAKAVHDNGSQ